MLETHRNRGSVMPLLLLFALLLGGGGYNYWRNLQAEPPRPYRSYADAELAQLVTAYEGDVTQRGQALPQGTSQGVRTSGPLLKDRLDDFEAAQRRGNTYRESASSLAGQQGVLRELQEEQQARAESPVAVHLRRLTTI